MTYADTKGHQGLFITFEGGDGCGKTTQIGMLAKELEARGWEVTLLREPGGTSISEKIRSILLNPANDEMVDECELLLMEASRAQLVRQSIMPELEAGHAVLCDRFFDSTYAYQSGGRGLPEQTVAAANALGSCGLVPDATVVLDYDATSALRRATGGGADRLEGEGLAFQQRIREAYRRLAERESSRVRLVDASGTPEQVAARVLDVLTAADSPIADALGRRNG